MCWLHVDLHLHLHTVVFSFELVFCLLLTILFSLYDLISLSLSNLHVFESLNLHMYIFEYL